MVYFRKTQLTQTQIKHALTHLINKIDFEKITINQIVECAKVTRSTFYRYYDDKYQLLSDIEDEVIQYIKNDRLEVFQKMGKEQMFTQSSIEKLLISLSSYVSVIKGLLSNASIVSFEMKLRREVAQRLTFINKNSQSNIKFDLAREYLVSILISTFKYWALNYETTSNEEISQFLIDVYDKGIIKALGINKNDDIFSI